jgi:hypothetical protein
MATARASGSIRPKALQRVLGATGRGYESAYEAWQASFGAFRGHLPPHARDRLQALGRTLWRFDLRYRWAIGITALEFDDRVVTRAHTGSTREGYFLLMRLVDLWFSLDLAHDLHAALFVRAGVARPSAIATLRRRLAGPLTAIREAARLVDRTVRERFRKPGKRAALIGYLRELATHGEGAAAAGSAQAAGRLEGRQALEPAHVLAVAQAIRNRYVHGGETASTKGFGSEEKVRLLRLLVGFVQVVCTSLVTNACAEMQHRLKRRLGMR